MKNTTVKTAEEKAKEAEARRIARDTAETAHITGKTAYDILKNRSFSFDFAGKTYTAYAKAAANLEDVHKRGLGGKTGFYAQIRDEVSRMAVQRLRPEAPQTARKALDAMIAAAAAAYGVKEYKPCGWHSKYLYDCVTTGNAAGDEAMKSPAIALETILAHVIAGTRPNVINGKTVIDYSAPTIAEQAAAEAKERAKAEAKANQERAKAEAATKVKAEAEAAAKKAAEEAKAAKAAVKKAEREARAAKAPAREAVQESPKAENEAA